MPGSSRETSGGGWSPRSLAPLLVGLLLLALLVVVTLRRSPAPAPTPDVAAPAPAPAEPAPAPAKLPPAEPAPPAPSAALELPVDPASQPPDPDEVALRWAVVDLEAVRAAMPDNLYWKMSAPTQDPELIRWREEERARWNQEYGRVLSGTATEEEVVAYYAGREQLSLDSIQFASYLLDHYRQALPGRDVGLLELAIRMHHARLEELPKRLAEGLERQQRQQALREAWLRDREAFEAGLPDE